MNADDVDDIISLLNAYGVPFEEWRRGRVTRSFEDFKREIERGEVRLEVGADRLVLSARIVAITVTAIVADETLILRESRQKLSDGNVWKRANPEASICGHVGYRDINLVEAVRRTIMTRLGMPKFLPLTMLTEDPVPHEAESGESEAYPGLAVRYRINYFDWLMPPAFYNPQGYAEQRDDRIICYEWLTQPIKAAE